MTDSSRVFQLAFSGRAILLAGQNLEPESGRLLREALLKDQKLPAETSLGDACALALEPDPIVKAIKLIAESTNKVMAPFRNRARLPLSGGDEATAIWPGDRLFRHSRLAKGF